MNLAQMIRQHPEVPPLEIQAQLACQAKIDEALKAYGCELHFEQIWLDGRPVGARWVVLKSPQQRTAESKVIGANGSPAAANGA